MEKLAFQSQTNLRFLPASTQTPTATPTSDVVTTDWRSGLPVLSGVQVTMREMRVSDARSLFTLLTTEEVARFISPPPSSVEGFEQFIASTYHQRLGGTYACFAVTIKGSDTAIGIFQVRGIDRSLETAEWGFAIGSAYWGTGVFEDGAALMLRFVFDTIGIHRLEARAAVRNGRGNGALGKIGAVREGILRQSFLKNGEYLDQMLWAILADEWRGTSTVWEGRVH